MMNHIISEIKNGGKDRRCGSKNGHELHVTRESKRHKLEAYEQDSHHDDPGCKTSKNVASSLKETKAIDSCSMRRPLDSPENISLEHKTCNQPHIEPYAKYKFIYKFPWMPAAPCPNQDGSVIGVPEVTNTSSTTEEQREDGSVNEVPELTNTSNTTGEEPREADYVTLTTESATPNITGEEENEDDSLTLASESATPSKTGEEAQEDDSLTLAAESATPNKTGEEAQEADYVTLASESATPNKTGEKSQEAVEGFKDTGVIHDTDIHSDGRHTAHNSQEDKRTEMSELHDIEKKSSTDAKSLVAEDEKLRNLLNLLSEEEKRKFINRMPSMGKSYADEYIEALISVLLDSEKKSIDAKTLVAEDKGMKERNQADKNILDLISKLSEVEIKPLTAGDENLKERNQSNFLLEEERRKFINRMPSMGKSYDTLTGCHIKSPFCNLILQNDPTILSAELVPSNATGTESGEAVEGFKDTGVIHDTDIHSDITLFNICHMGRIYAVEGFKDTGVIHDNNILSDGHHTAHNSQEDKRTEIPELHNIETKTITDAKYLVAEDKKMKEKIQDDSELSNTSDTTGEEQREAVEGFKDTGVIHDPDIHSDGRHTAHNSQEHNRTEMSDCIVMECKQKWLKEKLKQQADLAISKVKAKSSSSEIVSEQKSAGINVYISVIRNETFRMMESIDIIVSQAMQLFGPERTPIFLDLLADMLPIFGSAGAIPGFVPNMAESAIRDQVISFFKQAHEMKQKMTSLLSCLDSERLQKMPEPDFRALLEIIIEFSLESKSNIAKGLCVQGNRLITVDFQQFAETLGENFAEDILNRLRLGHEKFVYRFVDKDEKRSQTTEKRENRLIHSVYFPSDCRLFIYIPTDKGSYWHNFGNEESQ